MIKLVNFIRAQGLNPRQFIQLLEESGTEHTDVLYHPSWERSFILCGSWEERLWRFWGMEVKQTSLLSCKTWIGCVTLHLWGGCTEPPRRPKCEVTREERICAWGVFTCNSVPSQADPVFSTDELQVFHTHFPMLATLNVSPCHTDRYSTTLKPLHPAPTRLNQNWCWCPLPFQSTARKCP